MGKNNRHKKFLKLEKSKVKLKAKQKILSKGQNVTDTSFKFKKIVVPIQQQVCGQSEDQAVTKKNLTIKDLLSRSKNSNVNVKLGALSGLSELALQNEVVVSNLCSFIETSASLCVDPESSVRQEALRFLHYLLRTVTPVQLEPFVPLLVSYLSVAMSHLNQGIQIDALRMLNIFLTEAPNSVSRAVSLLLPALLEMISVEHNTTRNLSMNLSSSNTSTRKRIQVLGCLHTMLQAVMTVKTSMTDKNVSNVYHWSSWGSNYAPCKLWPWNIDDPCDIPGPFGTASLPKQDLFEDQDKMKKYILVLMSLLFDTWIEVCPTQTQQNQEGIYITSEATELLECLLNIMQHLWQFLESIEHEKGNKELTMWFQENFEDRFVCHFMRHFPFISTITKNKGRKFNKQKTCETSFVGECTNQNLSICYLLCCLCKKPTRQQIACAILYMKERLESEIMLSDRSLQVLHKMLNSKQWAYSDRDYIADLAQRNLCRLDVCSRHSTALCSLLCDFCLSDFTPDRLFDGFIAQLPMYLTYNELPAKCLETAIHLALRRNTTFLTEVKFSARKIIENIPVVEVQGILQTQVQSNLIEILYHASAWRSDILEYVSNLLLKDVGTTVTKIRFLELLENELRPKKPQDPLLLHVINQLESQLCDLGALSIPEFCVTSVRECTDSERKAFE